MWLFRKVIRWPVRVWVSKACASRWGVRAARGGAHDPPLTAIAPVRQTAQGLELIRDQALRPAVSEEEEAGAARLRFDGQDGDAPRCAEVPREATTVPRGKLRDRPAELLAKVTHGAGAAIHGHDGPSAAGRSRVGVERLPITRPQRWPQAITVPEADSTAAKRVPLAAVDGHSAEVSGLGGGIRESDVGESVAGG